MRRDLIRRAARIGALAVGLALACTSTSSPTKTPTQASDEVVTFTGLPPNDTVKVQIVQVGQWGDIAYELVFHGGQEHVVTVVKLSGKWSEKTKTFTAQRRGAPIDEKLPGDQLWQLNELLDYYRDGPPETCNDTQIITLERQRSGKTIASEHFVDKSCGPDKKKGVTTLWDVIDRASMQKSG